jgi:hypothetical protein
MESDMLEQASFPEAPNGAIHVKLPKQSINRLHRKSAAQKASTEVAMTKLLFFLAFVVIMLLIIVNRQRVYLRDPLATVYRDEVQQSGVQVYQNYSDDILIEKDGDKPFRILVQDWSEVPGTPVSLTCIRWMACLADDDHAATTPLVWAGKGKYDPKVAMTSREISFTDTDGSRLRVTLR